MVLQQAPAKSAVYGMVMGHPSAVKVTVTDETTGTSYDVPAEFNTTHQPWGPEFVGGEAGYNSKGAYVNGPYLTWKAFLKPAPAGGNFTISAVCTGCTEDGSFSNINITNVTMGDVWYVSLVCTLFWWRGAKCGNWRWLFGCANPDTPFLVYIPLFNFVLLPKQALLRPIQQ